MTSPSFAEFQLLEPIQRAVEAENYTTPTPIQAQSIPHLMAGRDLLGCAQTGTGKTAAFALPILHRLNLKKPPAARSPQVLVLCPTRELAAQIGDSFQSYGRFLRFRQAVIFGGVGQTPQVRALERGVHILIATPGRLLDLMNQGHLKLNQLQVFVLDEVDRMLDLGFLPDLKRILTHIPTRRQSLFFSATMPERIVELAEGMLTNPVRVVIAPQSTTVDLIDQKVMFVERPNKRALLYDVLCRCSEGRIIVFTRTKRGADNVARQLCRNGIQADAIHGDKSQAVRTRVLMGFRTGRVRVVVATDLAARGIDVDGITHVINYDIPNEPESYVHRIGRTGRAGAPGVAYSFCDSEERESFRAIEKLIRRPIEVHTDHAFHAPDPLPTESRPAAKRTTGRPGRKRSGARKPQRKPA